MYSPDMHHTPASDELSLVLVDQTQDARDAARLAAEQRLTAELNTGGRFKRAFNRFWKDRLWSEYYTQKYEREAQATIDATGDTLAYSPDVEGRARATQTLIDRFQAEEDSVIHEDAGERRDIVGPDSELASAIKDVIRRNVAGELDDAAMNEEKNRILAAFAEHSDEYAGLFQEGKVRVDNMVQIAEAVRAAVEHGESVEDVLSGMKIMIGEARNSVRTEINYSRMDRIVERFQGSKVGCLVDPRTISTAAAIAVGVTRFGGQRAAAALLTFAPAVASGAWAAIRENKRVKDERRQHSREMAMGGEIADDSRRREQMEATRYEAVSAQSLINELNTRFNEEGALADDEAVVAALAALAEAQARNRSSDSRRADLITYSSETAVGEERFALDLAIAQAKVTANNRIDADMRQRLGMDPAATLNDIILQASEQYTQTIIEEDMSRKDRAFRSLKAKRIAIAAATTAASTLLTGLVAQEATAAFDPTRAGLIDDLSHQQAQSINGQQHNTLLYSFMHGENGVQHIVPSANYNTLSDGHVQISADHAATITNGEMQITDGAGRVVVDHLAVNPDGTLPPASIDALRQHGMTVDESVVQTGTETKTHKGSAKEFLRANDATRVKRDFWYDNDTPAPKFDKNELKFWKAGVDDSGVGKNGHFKYSVGHMTEGGSYHGSRDAQWDDLAESGKLRLALSATKGTQGEVLFVDIKPDGSIDIDPDSPAGQLFDNRDGKAVFRGAYMEVVEDAGEKKGVVHIRPLATVVGENDIKRFSYTTEDPIMSKIAKITTNGYDVPETYTEAAPGIPLATRRPLEMLAARRRETAAPEARDYYSSEISDADRERIRREISPRLQRDPDARLQLWQEVDWYRDALISRTGRARVDRIETQVDSTRELREMPSGLETIITIPVAASKESENIYKTLSLYGQQDPEALNKSMIIINLNWFDKTASSPEEMAKVQKTADEIERVRRDFPQLNIAVVRNQYEADKVNATGGVIGYVASDLIDTALLAVRHNIDEGRIKRNQDVTIIRHDADMQGISRHHLKHFQESTQGNTVSDLFKGVTRFGVRSNQPYPGFGIASGFSSALSVMQANEGMPHTGGANFGVRAASLAAIGGLGQLVHTGAGSDDVEIGRRISVARDLQSANAPVSTGYRSYSGATAPGKRGKVYIKPVVGANIDTNPDRLIPFYLEGRPFQEAWGDRFSQGVGGHRDRDADAAIMHRIPKEGAELTSAIYRNLEANITFELQHADWSVAKRGLAIYFGAEPGLYTVKRSNRGIEFKFTTKGKEWVKRRIERESSGKFGPYGMRKMRQLYGDTSHKRQPVPALSPLVSPIS